MKKIIPKIIEKHSIGANCGTNAARVALQYFGHELTEDMVFGMGSGLGFIYQYYPEEDKYFISGKNESLENNICSLLGGTCISGFWDNNELAWEHAKYFIDHDIPVILDTSIMHLPYFQPYMESLSNISFGLHNVMLIGYDEGEKQVMLLDHKWNDPKIISMQELSEARNAKDSSVQPRNGYRILLPAASCKGSLERDIKYAILLNISRMRNPFAYKLGLKGMNLFKRDVLRFYEDLENKGKYLNVFGIFLEKLGTGGGNYRRVYGNFLKNAGRQLDDPRYTEIGNQYMKTANNWKYLANMFLKNDMRDIGEVEKKLNEIILEENIGMDKLEEVILHG